MDYPKLLLLPLLTGLSASVMAKDCIPTPHRTTGTHYEPVTEQKGNIGKGLVFQGRVLSSPDCTPVAYARVAHWQAGINGRYSDNLRGYLFSDAQGRFRFETEWPNLVPPHIHFIITKDGYGTLETQWIGDAPEKTVVFNIIVEKN